MTIPKQYFIESLYVLSEENEKRHDYIKLKELPVIIRYMRYFMKYYINPHFKDGKLDYMSQEDWDD